MPTIKNSISQLEENILTVLAGRDLYGLEIIKALVEASGGKIKIGFGSLYPTLHRMEKQGFIKASWGDESIDERAGARRRYYSVTGLGERALAQANQFRVNLRKWVPA